MICHRYRRNSANTHLASLLIEFSFLYLFPHSSLWQRAFFPCERDVIRGYIRQKKDGFWGGGTLHRLKKLEGRGATTTTLWRDQIAF